MNTPLPTSPHIGIIGLGYVGLPLAIALGRLYPILGLDTNHARIAALHRSCDRSRMRCGLATPSHPRRITLR